MPAPADLHRLLEQFERHRDSYRSPNYNETQARLELIDPLFKCLGWDMHNERGYAEAYKDVIHEDAIKIGGATKAPDYCFRIGGNRKFFLEAKKPSVNLKTDPEPAYQLRRYAWSAGLPLSILTDFEEFVVYDCRVKPALGDKSSVARTMYLTYKDYIDKWDLITETFSRDAVLKGSFDKYAETTKLKRGTATVDVAFLQEIERWRDLLAKNLALRNQSLTQRELNYAVQVTLDRILFLRMCEDRGIEVYHQLCGLVQSGPNIYGRLKELFYAADDRYNSGLFYFRKDRDEEPDNLTPDLVIDDKVLKDIIGHLYYPESPYEFSVLPAEILGQVYEQFLGKVIRLTDNHQAKIEEKPEVRKAGGVYYTPTYIVDYIVKNTVGKLVGAPVSAKALEAAKAANGTSSVLPPDPATPPDAPAPPDAPTPRAAPDAAVERNLFRSPPPDPATPPGAATKPDAATPSPAPSPSPPTMGGEGRGEGGPTPTPGLTPRQVSKLRILDPACGSGSFLLGAYQFLLDWHRDWYVNDGPEKHQKEIYQGAGGLWYLTTQEKKRILVNNIYGVDIDPQAVEVTKLSLLLKVLEGENKQTLEKQMTLYHERALPDLSKNIKCGNSLIGPEFYEDKKLDLFAEDDHLRLNVFSWEKEFPSIMGPGGFDVVLGNPPYVLLQDEFRDGPQLAFFRAQYKSAAFKLDTYHLFIEKAIRLTALTGRCSMITPANFLTNNFLSPLRRLMLTEGTLEHVLVVDGGVFEGISVDNAIFVMTGKRQSAKVFEVIHAIPENNQLRETKRYTVQVDRALLDEYSLFVGGANRELQDLWKTLDSNYAKLGDMAHVNFGKQLRDRKLFPKDVIEIEDLANAPKGYRPCYTGKNTFRYHLEWDGLACLDDQVAQSGGCWDPDRQNAVKKIVTRQIGKFPEYAIDAKGFQCLNTMFMINVHAPRINPLAVLGILNSSLLRAFWIDRFYDRRRTFPKIKGGYLKLLPMYAFNLDNEVDRASHDTLCASVSDLIIVYEKYAAARTDHVRNILDRQIDIAEETH